MMPGSFIPVLGLRSLRPFREAEGLKLLLGSLPGFASSFMMCSVSHTTVSVTYRERLSSPESASFIRSATELPESAPYIYYVIAFRMDPLPSRGFSPSVRAGNPRPVQTPWAEAGTFLSSSRDLNGPCSFLNSTMPLQAAARAGDISKQLPARVLTSTHAINAADDRIIETFFNAAWSTSCCIAYAY